MSDPMKTPVDPQATPAASVTYAANQPPKRVDLAAVPNAPAVDHNGIIVGRWKSGIFDCLADIVPNCVMSFICPCVSLAQTLHRVGMYPFTNVLVVFGAIYGVNIFLYLLSGLGVPLFFFGSWIAFFLQVAVFAFLVIVRMRIRRAFRIAGSELEDLVLSFFCSCCVLAQIATHTDSYTANECSFSPKEILPGYQIDV
ncbi:unnamed protein product [Aphanomyces euteiches]|uniref:Uncharacterized protein n=1 Tax=Aphanomyces euteiches TaxID=100861 RepID=A0A6G0XCJ2_9STRA|nr:hypothetical protein Ae201684_006202 [Aphanomyces euteiches]KAH9068683.1 hypothetical protein Ae201684P_004385 [Aphanomyces euteiches]KAH9145857.1 hypothetical protein AeRB84_010251 [Aphanomyces euteiches]